MADNFGPDLHQLLPQRRERPVLDLLWQSKRPHEVGEIVGQGVKLEPNLVVIQSAPRREYRKDNANRGFGLRSNPASTCATNV